MTDDMFLCDSCTKEDCPNYSMTLSEIQDKNALVIQNMTAFLDAITPKDLADLSLDRCETLYQTMISMLHTLIQADIAIYDLKNKYAVIMEAEQTL